MGEPSRQGATTDPRRAGTSATIQTPQQGGRVARRGQAKAGRASAWTRVLRPLRPRQSQSRLQSRRPDRRSLRLFIFSVMSLGFSGGDHTPHTVKPPVSPVTLTGRRRPQVRHPWCHPPEPHPPEKHMSMSPGKVVQALRAAYPCCHQEEMPRESKARALEIWQAQLSLIQA